MKTNRIMIASLGAILLGLAPLGFGQFASTSPSPHRTLGYYDSATGSFTPLHVDQDAEAAAVTPTTGTFTFNFTLNVKAAIPKNGIVTCAATASVFDSGSGFTSDEHAFGPAKLVSGTTYSCALSLHYSWLLGSPTTDMISLGADAEIDEGIQITATNGTTTTVMAGSARGSTQSLGSIKVPANGATTTETVNITL
jgi:hypothetical protein